MPQKQAWAALALAALLLLVPILRRALQPAPPSPLPPPARGAARLLYELPLDPNRDGAEALAALPGIGPDLAGAMVAGRPWCSVDALRRVHGIGPARLARIRSRLRIEALPPGCPRD